MDTFSEFLNQNTPFGTESTLQIRDCTTRVIPASILRKTLYISSFAFTRVHYSQRKDNIKKIKINVLLKKPLSTCTENAINIFLLFSLNALYSTYGEVSRLTTAITVYSFKSLLECNFQFLENYIKKSTKFVLLLDK